MKYQVIDGQGITSTRLDSKSGMIGATLTMIKSLIGTGILALPYAVQFCGWRCGLVILTVLLMLSNLCIRNLFMVVESIYGQEKVYYEDIGLRLFGSKMAKLISFFIFFFTFGCCVGYVIFMRQFFSEVLSHLGVSSPLLTLLITFLLIFPFIFVEDYSSLKSSSLIGVCLFGFSCIYMIDQDIKIIQSKSPYNDEFSIHGVLMYLGISVYAFEGAGTLFHLRESMKDPTQIHKCFAISSIIAYVFYTVFQTLTLYAYGSNLQQIALMNFQYSGWGSYLAKIGFSMQVLFSIPVNIFICFQMTEKAFKIGRPNNIKYLIRLLIVSVIFVIAYVFPSFSHLLSIIGGFGGIIIQFVFPCLMYLKYYEETITQPDKVLNLGILGIGTLASLIVTYETIISMFQ